MTKTKTKEEYIEIIRKHCVKAYPDMNSKDIGNGMVSTCLCIPEIGIAEVLVAINKVITSKRIDNDKAVVEITSFGMFIGNTYDWEYQSIFWKLKENNIEKQTLETLEWVVNLLDNK